MTTYQALESVKTEEGNILSVVEKNIDELPDGDLLIKVSYSSLNYKDAMSASGMPGVTRNYPHTPGIDAVGEVDTSSNNNFKEGDKVIVTGYDLGMNTAGGFGQYIRVPAEWATLLPNGLSENESMSLGTAGLTAGLSVHALETYRGNQGFEGTKSIVTGATGGVGSIALMLLSKLNSEVTAVTGKKEQTEFLTGLGASEIILREDLQEVARKPIGKSIWDLGVDVVSGDVLTMLLTSLTPGGAVACSGLVGGPSFESSIFPFILRGNALLGIDSVEIPLDQKSQIWDRFSSDWKLDLTGLTKEVSLDGLEKEVQTILQGGQVGRIVVNLT
ncbi:MAG: YhdH/YhfP family quinone oxidoreductase [SAR86 cluster bacterium]|jgi:alcohol dehydrogenase|nr:YhdH/YhfP family quinone oxidoreductase [SAR86 cluster bacterium]|tara:strand:- start:7079 stop:8071 length:993 start_codon:yes stop_codon:yes gene_type:complete